MINKAHDLKHLFWGMKTGKNMIFSIMGHMFWCLDKLDVCEEEW